MKNEKPITLVYDPVRGGKSLEVIKRDECPDELREDIFGGRKVIEWHRIQVRPALSHTHDTRARPPYRAQPPIPSFAAVPTGLPAGEPQAAG